MNNILIGADPEIFVKNHQGVLISAHGMVEGTKEKPFKVPSGAVQVDGMALEFNIKPSATRRAFCNNITRVQNILADMVKEHGSLEPIPTAHFTEEYMAGQPEEALELGCEPDYDAYTGKANPRPNGKVNFRTGAGHIHIGWTQGKDPHDATHFQDCRIITKVLDNILFPLSECWDKDEERRKLYGKVGAFRPKPYGVEYRVLSNAWLREPFLVKFVYEVVNAVTKGLLERTIEMQRFLAKQKSLLSFLMDSGVDRKILIRFNNKYPIPYRNCRIGV